MAYIIRGNLICRIAANHVHYGFITARVKLEPSIHFKDILIDNCDRMTLRDHALDLTTRKEGMLPHFRHYHFRGLGGHVFA